MVVALGFALIAAVITLAMVTARCLWHIERTHESLQESQERSLREQATAYRLGSQSQERAYEKLLGGNGILALHSQERSSDTGNSSTAAVQSPYVSLDEVPEGAEPFIDAQGHIHHISRG